MCGERQEKMSSNEFGSIAELYADIVRQGKLSDLDYPVAVACGQACSKFEGFVLVLPRLRSHMIQSAFGAFFMEIALQTRLDAQENAKMEAFLNKMRERYSL